MERQLPLVDIMGTAFYLDSLREELWQKDNTGNRISFNVFRSSGAGYSFLYDKERKCAVEDPQAVSASDPGYQWVTLEALMELDPEGIALRYGIPLEVLRSVTSDKPKGQTQNAETRDEGNEDRDH